jgi:mycothiol system anti-sigma-R factor
MTCEEALKKLYEVVDKEASEIDVRQVREHLEHCRDCMSRYEFEEALKAFVIEKATSPAKTGQLKANILTHIEQYSQSPGRFWGGHFRYGAVLLSAVAALVVCIVSALVVAEFYRHKEFVYPFEKHHMFRELYAASSATGFGDFFQARHYLTNDMHLSIDIGDPVFNLVNTGFDEINGRQFVHFRFIDGDNHISLFVGKADGVYLPDFERVDMGDSYYFQHLCGECQVIYWTAGEAIAVAVSENKQLDLTPLIPVVRSI